MVVPHNVPDPQSSVSIFIQILPLLGWGGLFTERGIRCKYWLSSSLYTLPLFNSINLFQNSSTLHMTENAKRRERGKKRELIRDRDKRSVTRGSRQKAGSEREWERDRQKKRLMRQSTEIENWMIRGVRGGKGKIREEESRRSSYPFALQLIKDWMRLLS